MTAAHFIDKMVTIFSEINLLSEDLKPIKDEAKEQGFDPAELATIAKAKADDKLGKLRSKLEKTLDTMDSLEE